MTTIVLFLTPKHLEVLTREHTLRKCLDRNGDPISIQIRFTHTHGDAFAEILRLEETAPISPPLIEEFATPKRKKPWWRHA